MPSINGIIVSSDWHCGWYHILTNATITIFINRQSSTFGTLTIDGMLIVDGQLLQEP